MMTSADILMKIQTRFILYHANFLKWEHRCNQSPDELSIRIRNEYATKSDALRFLMEDDLFSDEDIQQILERAWELAKEWNA